MRKVLLLLIGLLLLSFLGLAAFGWYQTSRPAYRLARGREALRRGDQAEARSLAARMAAAGNADHAHLLRGMVFASLAEGQVVEGELTADGHLYCRNALREFQEVKNSGPLRVEARARIGLCLLLVKELGQAERFFHSVLAEQPDQVDAHRGLAAVYYDLGALNHAMSHLEEVSRLAPDDGRPHRLLGLIHKDLDHAEPAVAHYREALNRTLGEGMVQEVRVELAEVLVRLSRYAEALEQIDGKKPSPGDVGKAVALRAECFWGLGRTGEARELLDEALGLNLKAPEILRLRAKLHQEAGETREAIHLYEELVAADRHDHASRYQLALALEAQGRKKEAAEQRALTDQTRGLLDELTRLTEQAMQKPNQADLRRQLAAVCEKLDKWELAAMWRSAADTLQTEARPDGGAR